MIEILQLTEHQRTDLVGCHLAAPHARIRILHAVSDLIDLLHRDRALLDGVIDAAEQLVPVVGFEGTLTTMRRGASTISYVVKRFLQTRHSLRRRFLSSEGRESMTRESSLPQKGHFIAAAS